jgi:hypothetical protein
VTTWGWNINLLGGTKPPNGGNSNGGQATRTTALLVLPGAPTLPLVNLPYSGSECSSYLHTTMCNGSSSDKACVTQDLCVPTKPCYSTYSARGTPACSGEYSIYLSTTIFTRCRLVGGVAARADATAAPSSMGKGSITAVLSVPTSEPIQLLVLATSTLSPHTSFPTHLYHSHPHHHHKRSASNELGELEVSVPNAQQNLSSAAMGDLSLISARQNNNCGGSANGGCDYIRFCALGMCAKTEDVPCLVSGLPHPTPSFPLFCIR